MKTGNGMLMIATLAIAFVLAATEDANAQQRVRYRGSYSSYSSGIRSYPGGAYRGTTTIRSYSRSPSYHRHGPSYNTIYFTNRAPVYRYSVGHPLSQSTRYSRNPYPHTTYRAPTVIRHYTQPHHYHVPTRRPGITIGIQF